MTTPGHHLRRVASGLCRRETMERVIDPIVADLQSEYAEAARSGRAWQARLVLWRGYLGFWRAIGMHATLGAMQGTPGQPDGGARRAAAFSALAFAVMTALLVWPPLMAGIPWGRTTATRMLMVATLIPQALPLSIPAGVCIGIIVAMRGSRASARRLASVLSVGFLAAVAAWLVVEWMIPAANTRFRELVIAEIGDARLVHIVPGLNELGLTRLGQRADLPAVRHFHLLLALIVAAIPLATFALALSLRVRRLPVAILAGVASCAAYILMMFTLDNALPTGLLAIVAIAWTPDVVFLLAGVALLRTQMRSSA